VGAGGFSDLKEIPEITGMRGYASLSVIIFHFFTISGLLRAMGVPSLVLSWNSGLDFFFVLSGFLLSAPFLGVEKVSLKRYYIKRVFRILPVYYLCIGVLGVILLYFDRATLQQLVASLFFLQGFSPSTFNAINGVTWTLVIEEIFYATLPVFSIFFVRERWRYALPVCIAASVIYRIVVIQIYASNNLTFHLWQYPSFLGHYAIGVTLANFYVNKKMQSAKFSSSIPLILAIATLLVSQYFIGSRYSIFNDVMAFPGVLFAIEYGALIYFSLTSPAGSRIRSIFTNRIITYAGTISYSTYTWHLPIEVWLYQLGLPTVQWVFVSVVISLSVATASYRLVETRFLRLRDKFLSDARRRGIRQEEEEELPSQRIRA
jgi:peptidoglycan/LPS O-acetylase OafA/YrhL